MNPRKKIRLGDLLVDHKLISQAQLEQALSEQKKSGQKLGRVLISDGYLTEDQMLEALSEQLKIPFVDLVHYKFNPDIIKLIPEIQSRRFRAVALSADENGILVGMADPTNIFAYDELSRILKKTIRLAVVREIDLLKTIDTVYRKTDQISGFAEQLNEELSESDIDLGALLADADVADAPVVKLLQSLFEDAIQIKASDIHIEPDEKVIRIRQRVDGVLQEHIMDEIRIAPALVLRLKLMAGLDISEKRLPQDGRFSLKIKDHNIDVRLSTMPVQYGESVVMRLLDQTGGTLSIDTIGMPKVLLKRFETLIQRPHGMILVTGPTGSGKTTTLYAALQTLNVPEKKIITVEDPVEYKLPRINQVQVHTDIGLTFSTVLRSALRQDPDIVLIGEMRDEETAEIALRAAMTGHLVLSTLHTNDAVSTVNRLLDMGIKSYLLASALHAILAQRLVRRVCESCAQLDELDDQQKAWLSSLVNEKQFNVSFKKGIGCAHCNYTGYQGRIGVYELLELDKNLSDILSHGDSGHFVREATNSKYFRPLNMVALQYAVEGITTMDEVIRISADIDSLVDKEIVSATEEAIV
ncbi:MAG: Flp pilus assembly complex ATPase component TadA [Proteobacteria bacterium]|nr:GspE/PulE family protein [Pseudomonadota bacterium]NOG60208.1 Flp pilus assembly complex ATPase component TadA [Pseudomonadota bacterium]